MNYLMRGGDGKAYGPVPAETVRAWFREGRANLQTQLSPEGMETWWPLGEIPEFTDLAAPPPAGAPPFQAAFPAASPVAFPQTCGLATASLVLGILSPLRFGPLTGIPAIICGHQARGKIQRSNGALTGDGMALAGLILGYISLVFIIFYIGLMAAIAVPNFVQARNISQRSACVNNLRLIDGAKEQWALENNARPESLPTWSQLVGPDKYLKITPTCKTGGVYSLNRVDTPPACTKPGHMLPQ